MVWSIAVFAVAILIAILVVTLRAREGEGLDAAVSSIRSLEEELRHVKQRLENLETIAADQPSPSIEIDDAETSRTSQSVGSAGRSRTT